MKLSIVKTALLFFWVGPGALIAFLLGITEKDSQRPWEKTEKFKDTVLSTTRTIDSQTLVDIDTSITVSISCRDKNIYYKSTNSGLIEINLVKDLNLVEFEKQQDIAVKISSNDPIIQKTLDISTNDWTIPYFRVQKENVYVENIEGNKVIALGKAVIGEKYKVLHQTDDLVKIQYNSTEGYIPLNSGIVLWSAIENR